MSRLSCVGKLFLKQKWTQTVTLFSVFNPAVFGSPLESCCGQLTGHTGHFSTSQGKQSVTVTVKTKWASEADRPELYPGPLKVSRLLKLNETHYLRLSNEEIIGPVWIKWTTSTRYLTGFWYIKHSLDPFPFHILPCC